MTPVYLRIREQRERKGWTQLELARAARVPQSTISRLERRAVSRLDVPLLEQIAAALEVPLSRLLKVE
jgi:transcriptional regulator with XRE-family HTH domain